MLFYLLSADELRELLERLGYPLYPDTARGAAPAGRAAGRRPARAGRELELDPVIVSGDGAVAVDIRGWPRCRRGSRPAPAAWVSAVSSARWLPPDEVQGQGGRSGADGPCRKGPSALGRPFSSRAVLAEVGAARASQSTGTSRAGASVEAPWVVSGTTHP